MYHPGCYDFIIQPMPPTMASPAHEVERDHWPVKASVLEAEDVAMGPSDEDVAMGPFQHRWKQQKWFENPVI